MFSELVGMLDIPIAYDLGIDIKTERKRKKRKGSKGHSIVFATVLTSKELSEISGNLIAKMMKHKG